MVFVIVDDVSEKTRAFSDDENGWKIFTLFTLARLSDGFAMWTKRLMICKNVIFTTVA